MKVQNLSLLANMIIGINIKMFQLTALASLEFFKNTTILLTQLVCLHEMAIVGKY